jgi:GGDEF domain-containing protein/membrane protein implicated in regulation of membrane protease activity
MRFLVAALIVWLFLFYNIERLSDPINLSSVAYTFVPLMAVLTILAPRLRKVPLGVLLVIPIPIFLVFKAWVGRPIWGTAIPLTVTEICVIALTTILARWVSSGLSEFESAIAHITIGRVGKLPEPFSTGQGEMYREVRRARHHQRPLMLMAIGVEEESVQVALDRMVQEVQRAMMKQYVLSGVSKILCDELADYNIIAQRNDHFLALLPEVTPAKLTDLIERLHKTVSERVGVTLQIGTASFPEDAMTFESLMEKAVREMDAEPEPGISPQSQRLTTEHHTI